MERGNQDAMDSLASVRLENQAENLPKLEWDHLVKV